MDSFTQTEIATDSRPGEIDISAIGGRQVNMVDIEVTVADLEDQRFEMLMAWYGLMTAV